ncbi:WhiB family transcriptional regulator [Streptomyces sp. NPDC091649]|uniref:WhiB family transcriptional regulator n=1 Tax=Streptomyces sp. NPDC091649 TaxID=3366004 RepID=UPI003825F3AB
MRDDRARSDAGCPGCPVSPKAERWALRAQRGMGVWGHPKSPATSRDRRGTIAA